MITEAGGPDNRRGAKAQLVAAARGLRRRGAHVTAQGERAAVKRQATHYFAGVTWTYQPPNVGSIVMLRPLGPA